MELCYLCLFLMINMLGGAFGGYLNYLRTEETSQNIKQRGLTENKNCELLRAKNSIILGIGASFIVPLFLQTISSNLIIEIKSNPLLFLVYISFCILAAVYSRSFFDSVAERALSIAKDAQQKSDSALQTSKIMEPLQRKLTETDDDNITRAITFGIEHSDQKIKGILDGFNDEIINAFQKSNYAYRTSKGIAKDLNQPESDVSLKLEQLEKSGLTQKIINKENNKILWALNI